MKKTLSRLLCAMLTALVVLACVPMVTMVTQAATYSGTVYYVNATTGNDSNDGKSEAKPFKTLDKVNQLSLKAGDAVLLARGEVWSGGWLWPKGSGTATAPITVSCYGDESLAKPSIISNYDTDFVSEQPSVDAVVYLENQNFVTIENLDVTNGTDNEADKFGIRVLTREGFYTDGCLIRNCRVSGMPWSTTSQTTLTGIACYSENYYGYISSLTIEDNEIYDCKSVGISINGAYSGCNSKGVVNAKSAKNVVVRGNYMQNIGKDGILTNNCNAPLVEYNVADNTHAYAKTSYHVAMWPFAAYKALYQFNESFNTKTTYDGSGFDCDYQCYYTTMQYNYSHDNAGGFMLICTEPANWDNGVAYNVGATVRYNISQNDQGKIFCLTCQITDTQIYNNTVYSASGNAKDFIYTYSRNGSVWPINTQFKNNIFYVQDGNVGFGSAKGTVWENNIIYSNVSSKYPKNDNDGGGSDSITASGNIFADPMLAAPGKGGIGINNVDAYKLLAGSPALGAGVVIANNGGRDYFGNPVSATEKPNIGAYNGVGLTDPNITTQAPSTQRTMPTTVPTTYGTTGAPTTRDPSGYTPGSVFTSYKAYHYGKTEGWGSGMENIPELFEFIKVNDGELTVDISEPFQSNQVTVNFSTDTTEKAKAQRAFIEAKAGSGCLMFTFTLVSAKDKNNKDTNIKMVYKSLCGASLSADVDEEMIEFKPGETKTIIVPIPAITSESSCVGSFQYYVKNSSWSKALTQLTYKVSSVCVAVKGDAPATTTAKPTTTSPTTTEKPATTVKPVTTIPSTKAPTTIKPTAPIIPTTAPVMVGDCNGDKAVNAKDLLLLKKYLANWSVTLNLIAADCNLDNGVNAKDVLRMREYLAHIIDSL